MSEQIIKNVDITGNPGALGLSGFGLATLMLSFFNMGFFPENLSIIAMAVFVGGLVQLIAGSMAWKKGNTFETVAFTGFGVFWLSFAYILVAPFGASPAGDLSLGLYLTLWGIFGLGLFFGTLKMGVKALIVVFALLVLTFFATAAGHFTLISIVGIAAGFFAFLLGAAALYTAIAIVLNELGYKLPI